MFGRRLLARTQRDDKPLQGFLAQRLVAAAIGAVRVMQIEDGVVAVFEPVFVGVVAQRGAKAAPFDRLDKQGGSVKGAIPGGRGGNVAAKRSRSVAWFLGM
jgi:hypothetical protein